MTIPFLRRAAKFCSFGASKILGKIYALREQIAGHIASWIKITPRKSTVLHLKTQNEGHIVRPSSGFSGACCKIQNFATGPFAYSTPVEMIKALSYLMQIVGILYIFCDISRLAAKRPTNFTERICCNGGIISHACDRSISQSSHLFQTIEADPSFL